MCDSSKKNINRLIIYLIKVIHTGLYKIPTGKLHHSSILPYIKTSIFLICQKIILFFY